MRSGIIVVLAALFAQDAGEAREFKSAAGKKLLYRLYKPADEK